MLLFLANQQSQGIEGKELLCCFVLSGWGLVSCVAFSVSDAYLIEKAEMLHSFITDVYDAMADIFLMANTVSSKLLLLICLTF